MSEIGPFSLPPATPEERKRALDDPGPSWRTWVFGSMLKIYIPLGFLIVDVWVVGTWLEAEHSIGGSWTVLATLVTLGPLLYAEFVVYAYLWSKPGGDPSRSVRSDFRPTWHRPFEHGRWTEAGRRIRLGLPPIGSEGPAPGEPDPSEFF